MIRKYNNHKPQTNHWHCEEKPHIHHEPPGRETKQSKQISLPHQDNCKTRMDIKQSTTKHRTITDSNNGSNNKQSQQQQNHHLRTNSSLSHWGDLMHFTGTKPFSHYITAISTNFLPPCRVRIK